MPYVANTVLGGMQADLGSLSLGEVDSAGVAFTLQTLEGWDSAEVRGQWTEREADHGAWASTVYLGSRPISIGGTVIAPSRAALDDALERLRSAAGLTDTTLIVYETVPKQAVVRRSGKPLFSYVTDRIATYSLMVTAADPRRYDVNLQSISTRLPSTTGGLTIPAALPWTMSATTVSGEIDALNAGNFETRPLLTITGPVSSPRIACQMPDGSVQFLTYSQDLLDGDVLVIDTDARTVILNGTVSRRRFLATPMGWPVIPAGQTAAFLFRANGYNSTAMLTARWRSAWM